MISVNIITYNELATLRNVIEQCTFADEIIVVDSYSTDGATEYLDDNPNVKLIQYETDYNFGRKRNVALDNTTRDSWVLRLDSDEVPSRDLIANIKEFTEEFEKLGVNRSFVDIYHLIDSYRTCNPMKGKEIRLFKNNEGVRYEGKTHEKLVGLHEGQCAGIGAENSIIHLKYLLNNNKREEYLEQGFYTEDNLNSIENPSEVLELPRDIKYTILNPEEINWRSYEPEQV